MKRREKKLLLLKFIIGLYVTGVNTTLAAPALDEFVNEKKIMPVKKNLHVYTKFNVLK